VRGIRPYQIGDPVRDIHWAATARTGEAHVRLHDSTARSQLLVVFNAERIDQQWSDRLMDYEEEDFERVIAVAATLCMRALNMGLCTGFATNMPIDDSEECTVFAPSGGAAREEELLTTFARLKILRTQNFPAFLESLTALTGMDMVILSPYDSESIQTAIRELRRSSNQVTFHKYQGGSV
jgi:uncharacterized protein (DUF58 family)